jgi:predicted nucleic acid-binding protein
MAAVNIPIGSRVYLDANLFIYAAECPASFPNLVTLLKRLDLGELSAVTSALTIAEVLVVPLRTRNKTLEMAYRNRLMTGSTLTISDISEAILISAATLRAFTPGIKLPDAIHVATAAVTGCTVFLTNDVRLATVGSVPGILVADLA